MAERMYYWVENGQRQGPFTCEQLAKLPLTPNSLLWHPGMEQWQRAYNMKEIRTLFPQWEQTRPVEDDETEPATPSANQYFLLIAGVLVLGVLGYFWGRSQGSRHQPMRTDTSVTHRSQPEPQTSNPLAKAEQRTESSPPEANTMNTVENDDFVIDNDRVAGSSTEDRIPNGFEDIDQPSSDISNLITDTPNYNRWKGDWISNTDDPYMGRLTLRDDGLMFWVLARVLFNCTGRFEGNKLILSFQIEDSVIGFKYPRCGTDILEMERLENDQVRVRWLHEELHHQVITHVPALKSVSLLRRKPASE